LVDNVFIYLEFMELGIDFTETGRMFFLTTLVTSNGFKVKRFFGLRIERFRSFGKLLIRFFYSRFVRVWSKIVFGIYGLLSCKEVYYGLDNFWVLSSYHYRMIF